MNNERSLENLRPFNTLPPEKRWEIARIGGIASGERRREIADIKYVAKMQAAAITLVDESREEYRQAIKRYVREEKRKAKRRKSSFYTR